MISQIVVECRPLRVTDGTKSFNRVAKLCGEVSKSFIVNI